MTKTQAPHTETPVLRTEIPVPEPDLTADEIVARAAALREMVKADADAAEERGCYSPELHEEFTRAGFYRILQPRRFGGYEFDVGTLIRVTMEIGRADPGIAWGMCLAAAHVLHVASFYSEEAQLELMSPDGHFASPHRAAPSGTSARVDGGYVVNGRWDYSSGISYATHFMATAMTPGPEGEPPRPYVFVIPRDEVTVLDDWGGGRALGLQSTGSNTVLVEDVFVPERFADPYTWKSQDIPPEGTPGYQAHGNPMYLGRPLALYLMELIAPMVGAAYGALDEYELLLHSRVTIQPPPVPRTESADFQRWYGEAMGRADAAKACILAAADDHTAKGRRWVETGEPFTIADDTRIRGLVQQSGQLAWNSVDLLFATAGTSAAKRGSRLLRFYRDVSMYRTHIGAQYDVYSMSNARAMLGQPITM